MERFVIIVNGFQPLTIITKRSILGSSPRSASAFMWRNKKIYIQCSLSAADKSVIRRKINFLLFLGEKDDLLYFYALLSDEKVNFKKIENSKPELTVNKIVLRETNIQKDFVVIFSNNSKKKSKKRQYKNAALFYKYILMHKRSSLYH